MRSLDRATMSYHDVDSGSPDLCHRTVRHRDTRYGDDSSAHHRSRPASGDETLEDVDERCRPDLEAHVATVQTMYIGEIAGYRSVSLGDEPLL